MAHRYWRARFLFSGDTSYKEVAELEFRSSPGGTALSGTVTIEDNSFLGVGTAADLSDGDASTYVRWTNVLLPWVAIDLGVGNDVTVQELAITPRTGGDMTRVPRFIEVAWSDDNSSWTRDWYALETSWSAGVEQTFERPGTLTNSCRYWAIAADDVQGGNPRHYEIYMREYSGEARVTGDGTAIHSHPDGTNTPVRAFDDDTGTYAGDANGQYERTYVGYDFGLGVAQRVREVSYLHNPTGAGLVGQLAGGAVIRSNNAREWLACSNWDSLSWSTDETKVLYTEAYVTHRLVVPWSFEQTVGNVLQLLPNFPIREEWEWLTAIHASRDGSEQRHARRDTPRYRFQYDFTTENPEHYRARYAEVRSYLGSTITLPLLAYMTPLTGSTEVGGDTVHFDPDATDIRDEDTICLFNPNTGVIAVEIVDTVGYDGAALYTTASNAYGPGWMVMPAISAVLPETIGWSYGSVLGSGSFQLMSKQKRSLTPLISPSRLDFLNELPIMDHEPVVVQEQGLQFSRNVEIIDNETSLLAIYSSWDNTAVTIDAQWMAETFEQLLDFREFFDRVKGQCKPFYLPTYRHDLVITSEASSGSVDEFTTSTYSYLEMFEHEGFRQLMIEAVGESPLYLNVLECVDNGDDTLTVVVDDFLPTTEITRCSLVLLARLARDTVGLEHHQNYVLISTAIRSVDA